MTSNDNNLSSWLSEHIKKDNENGDEIVLTRRTRIANLFIKNGFDLEPPSDIGSLTNTGDGNMLSVDEAIELSSYWGFVNGVAFNGGDISSIDSIALEAESIVNKS